MVCAATLRANAVAFDSAADPAYAAGWNNGSNGGHGFGPWQINVQSQDNTRQRTGYYVGDASTTGGDGSGKPGSSGGQINSSGVSFGIFADYLPIPEQDSREIVNAS